MDGTGAADIDLYYRRHFALGHRSSTVGLPPDWCNLLRHRSGCRGRFVQRNGCSKRLSILVEGESLSMMRRPSSYFTILAAMLTEGPKTDLGTGTLSSSRSFWRSPPRLPGRACAVLVDDFVQRAGAGQHHPLSISTAYLSFIVAEHYSMCQASWQSSRQPWFAVP